MNQSSTTDSHKLKTPLQMYAFCAICSGVAIIFFCSDYQARPLKMLD